MESALPLYTILFSILLLITLPTTHTLIFNGKNPPFLHSFLSFSLGFQIIDLDLAYPDFYTQALRWTGSAGSTINKAFECDNELFLGGVDAFPTQNSQFTRKYTNLPSHNSITFSIWIRLIDLWKIGDNIDIMFDNINVGFQNTLDDLTSWAATSSKCGNNAVRDLDVKVFGKISHSGPDLTLKIINKRVTGTNLGTFGFRDVYLMMSNNVVTTEKWVLPFITGTNEVNVTNCTHFTDFEDIEECDKCWLVPTLMNLTACYDYTNTIETKTCDYCDNIPTSAININKCATKTVTDSQTPNVTQCICPDSSIANSIEDCYNSCEDETVIANCTTCAGCDNICSDCVACTDCSIDLLYGGDIICDECAACFNCTYPSTSFDCLGCADCIYVNPCNSTNCDLSTDSTTQNIIVNCDDLTEITSNGTNKTVVFDTCLKEKTISHTTHCETCTTTWDEITQYDFTDCEPDPTALGSMNCINCIVTTVPEIKTHCYEYEDYVDILHCQNIPSFDYNCTWVTSMINSTNCTNLGVCTTVMQNLTSFDACDVQTFPAAVGANLSNCVNTSAEFTRHHSCDSVFTIHEVITGLPNQFGCKSGFYWSIPDNDCMPCHSNCELCYGSSASECYKCANNRYFDGTSCIQCHSSCEICYGTTATTCSYCSPPNFYAIDNTCVSCDAPFIKSSATHYGFCVYPCKSGEYLYSDGSCYATCDSRFTTSLKYNKQLCNFQCNTGEILFHDGVCRAVSICPYPLKMQRYGAYSICEYPCYNGEIFYSTGICSLSTCSDPFVLGVYTTDTFGSFSVCESLCKTPPDIYRHHNNTCRSDCLVPLVSRIEQGVQICDPPLCGLINCASCSPTNPCQSYYHCDLFLGGFCLPDFTYYLTGTVTKTFVNGLTIVAMVSPALGIPTDANDNLEMTIPGLVIDQDYTTTIVKTSNGVFEININILISLEGRNLFALLTYSPLQLYLTTQVSIPRITFISKVVQKAVESVDGASQITFLLFVVSIVGMVVGGGLTSLWTALPESQYTYYLLYLNVAYLHHTQSYLESMDNYNLLAGSHPAKLDPSWKNGLPAKFFKLNYNPDFYANADMIFVQLVVILSCCLVFTLMLRFVRFPRQFFWFHKFLDTLMRWIKWNGLMRQTMTYIIPLSIAANVQLYTAIFGHKVPLQIFSILLAPAILLMIVWFLTRMFWFISHIPATRFERVMHTKKFGTLWEDLQTGSFGRYYFWIISIRGFLLAYVVVFIDMYPLIQVGILLFFQIFVVLLFFKGFRIRHLFTDKALNFITLIEEFLLLAMKVLILVTEWLKDSAEDSTLILIGWVIILCGVMTQVLQTGFAIGSQIRNRNVLWRRMRIAFSKFSRKPKKKKIRRLNMRAPRLIERPRPIRDIMQIDEGEEA